MAKLSNEELSRLMFDRNDCPGGHAGVFHALESGIRSDDIADTDVADAWAVLEEHFDDTAPLCNEMFDMLHDAYCPLGHQHD